MSDMELAKDALKGIDVTFAVVKDGNVISSIDRGIRPVLDLLDRFGEGGMEGWSVADKVVGKAPAMIYSLLKPAEIYAHVMTKDAERILAEAGIKYSFDVESEKIINHAGTDICPMEKAVENISVPTEAFLSIKETIRKLKEAKK